MKQVQLLGMTQEENNLPIFNYIDKKFDELKKFYQPKEPTQYLTRQEVAEMLSVDISTVHNLSIKGILQCYPPTNVDAGKLLDGRRLDEEVHITSAPDHSRSMVV